MNLKKLFLKRRSKNEKIPVNFQFNSKKRIRDLDEEGVRELFQDCGDVTIQKFYFDEGKYPVLLIYCEGLCNSKQITTTIFPKLEKLATKTKFKDEVVIGKLGNLPLIPLASDQGIESLLLHTFDGKLLLFFEEITAFYSIDIANPPQRSPEEPNTEVSVRGPRDGFTEDIHMNIALIRKRLKTNTLAVENYVIGRRSATKVSLLYIKDIVNMQFIEDIKQRLNHIDVDSIISATQLEETATNFIFSIFPVFDYTGRPDYTAQCLIRGRFVLIVDGSPTVSIAPINLLLTIKAPEDAHFNFLYISFARILRIVGLLISIFLPGFYIALVSYHQDQIPFLLLATISNSRTGIPLAPPLEIILVLALYELFREAGVRLPKAVGQTLTVVGGLIIGDAAIKAGLTSPSMVVIASLIAVSKYTLVNQIVSGVVTLVSFIILIFSMFLGLFGFFISSFAVLLILANKTSFGLPYLAPISPIKMSDFLQTVLMKPWKLFNKRPDILKTDDSTRQRDRG